MLQWNIFYTYKCVCVYTYINIMYYGHNRYGNTYMNVCVQMYLLLPGPVNSG